MHVTSHERRKIITDVKKNTISEATSVDSIFPIIEPYGVTEAYRNEIDITDDR